MPQRRTLAGPSPVPSQGVHASPGRHGAPCRPHFRCSPPRFLRRATAWPACNQSPLLMLGGDQPSGGDFGPSGTGAGQQRRNMCSPAESDAASSLLDMDVISTAFVNARDQVMSTSPGTVIESPDVTALVHAATQARSGQQVDWRGLLNFNKFLGVPRGWQEACEGGPCSSSTSHGQRTVAVRCLRVCLIWIVARSWKMLSFPKGEARSPGGTAI